MDESQLWDVRVFVYQHFAETTKPPHLEETASHFALTHSEAASAYEELHRRHAFFLKPGTQDILMANPFSGVDTPFKVYANEKTYLHVDAVIEASCAQSGVPIQLSVIDQQVKDSDVLVHFLLPFRDWYNDLTFT
jgi:hypothetical protein